MSEEKEEKKKTIWGEILDWVYCIALAVVITLLIKNLFFAGEVLDVDAFTGGYNLQIAFSTGFVAGNNC